MNTKEYDGFSDSFSDQPEQKAADPAPHASRAAAPSAPAPAAPSTPAADPAPAPAPTPAAATADESVPTKKASTTAAIWTALILGAAMLILLLVFIIQNNVPANFTYMTWKFDLPLGVAMLLAAIAGALIMALVGSVRIAQLSWQVRKFRKQQEKVQHTLRR
ncbi:MAG: lipopolysaccharide assembly protein LapA domain-containing protein [Dermabacter sp.]|nr:lipopolysaccharide assembly protein LapA domain-containing protein [Dermabacter sp.]